MFSSMDATLKRALGNVTLPVFTILALLLMPLGLALEGMKSAGVRKPQQKIEFASPDLSALKIEEYAATLNNSHSDSQEAHFVNRAQNLRSQVDRTGWVLEPRDSTQSKEHWSWKFIREGTLARKTEIMATGPKIVIDHGGGQSEIYENNSKGIEQSFIFQTDPNPKSDTLTVRGSFDTTLKIRAASTDRIIFSDDQQDRLVLGNLVAFDAVGKILASAFVIKKQPGRSAMLEIRVQDRNAVYPVTVDPLAFSPAATFETDQDGAGLELSVASVGDINADGFSDVVVGAPAFDAGYIDQGRLFLFLGSSTGLAEAPSFSVDGDRMGARLGAAVATAGDINGDGFSDVLVGAPGSSSDPDNSGQIMIYLGSSSGSLSSPPIVRTGSQAGERFGATLSTAGDVNGDGFSDILIGSPMHGNSHTQSGRVDLFFGDSSGLGSLAAFFYEGTEANEHLGEAVSYAGDVNGDGFADILVGADGAGANSGKALLF